MGLSGNDEIIQRPYVCLNNGIVIDVNEKFLALSGYGKDELIGNDMMHVLNNMLRSSRKVSSIEDIPSAVSSFLFNKQMDFKEVCIELQKSHVSEALYVIFIQQPFVNLNNPLSYNEQLLSDNLTGIAIYSAEDFTLLKASKEYERIQCEHNQCTDIIGKRVDEFFIGWHESAAKKVWKSVIQARKTAYITEHHEVNKSTGETVYFDVRVTPILDGERVKFLVISINDITDKVHLRKENEMHAQMIKQQMELLEAVIENHKDSVFIIDKHGNIILNNKADDERYSRKLSNIAELYEAGEYFDEAGNPLSFEQMPAYRLIQGERVENYKLILKRGNFKKYLNLNGTPIFDENRNLIYAFLFGTDITELIESKQLITKQKEQLDVIINNMEDAIFIIDKHERFILKNEAARSRFVKEPVVLRDIFDQAKFYEKDGREIPLEDMPIFHLLQGKNVSDRVIVMRTPIKEFYLSINCNPIFDEEGKFLMGVLSSRDVTKYMQNDEIIKAQQKALLLAEKKEKESLERLIVMKDEFLSLISHEFKTPLTVINSALQAIELLYREQLTDKVQAMLNKIKQNTYRQMRLVNNLLDITGANEGYFKLKLQNRDIVFITKVIVESVKIYAQQKGVNICFKTDRQAMHIALDEEKYEKIILNLLSNAIKFTPKGRSITVEMLCNMDRVRIAVIDEGIGIPKDKQEYIFERFGQVDCTYTRQAEGTGIGLSLVKLMVQAMGGDISVESTLGEGSSFRVELPKLILEDQSLGAASKDQIDSRLVQSIAIEFSDIYL